MQKTPVIENSPQIIQNNFFTHVSQPQELFIKHTINPGSGSFSPYPSWEKTQYWKLPASIPSTYPIHVCVTETTLQYILTMLKASTLTSVSILTAWVQTTIWTRPFIYFRAQHYWTSKTQTISGHPRVSLGNLCGVLVTTETREGWHTVISVLQENSPTPPVNKVHKSTKQNKVK